MEIIRVRTARPFTTVNAYLLIGSENILVDVGPLQGVSYISLVKGLKEFGLSLEDIDLVLVTHGHVDHWGLLRRVQEISGADAYVHSSDIQRIVDYEGYLRGYLDPLVKAREVYDLPQNLDIIAERYMRYISRFAEPPKNIESFNYFAYPVDDGWIKAMHVPGHSDGSVLYIYGDLGFSGDLILNEKLPVITDLTSYIESLDKVVFANLKTLYPGHGLPIINSTRMIMQIKGVIERLSLIHI